MTREVDVERVFIAIIAGEAQRGGLRPRGGGRKTHGEGCAAKWTTHRGGWAGGDAKLGSIRTSNRNAEAGEIGNVDIFDGEREAEVGAKRRAKDFGAAIGKIHGRRLFNDDFRIVAEDAHDV